MVVEYIRYTVPAEQAAAFEDAYRHAGSPLEADPHCLAFEIARGLEEPEHFIVRIGWDSLEGHEQGFRTSPRFKEFFAAQPVRGGSGPSAPSSLNSSGGVLPRQRVPVAVVE
jgi:heme-degrading monooxygenase HmoA